MSLDPFAHLVVGDMLPETVGELCRAYDYYECTREPGHPGQHIATDAEWSILAVWPQDGAS